MNPEPTGVFRLEVLRFWDLGDKASMDVPSAANLKIQGSIHGLHTKGASAQVTDDLGPNGLLDRYFEPINPKPQSLHPKP